MAFQRVTEQKQHHTHNIYICIYNIYTHVRSCRGVFVRKIHASPRKSLHVIVNCYAMLSLSVASFSLHGRNAVMHENLGSRQLNPTKPRYGTQMHAVCLLLPPKKHMQRLPNVSKLHKRFQCLRNARIRANQMHLAIWSFFHT